MQRVLEKLWPTYPQQSFFSGELFFLSRWNVKKQEQQRQVLDFPEFQERTQTEETQGEKKQSVSSLDSVLRTPLIYHTRLWELGNKELWNKEGAWLNSACSHVWSTANFPSQIHLHIHAHVLRSTSPCVWRVWWLAALLHSFPFRLLQLFLSVQLLLLPLLLSQFQHLVITMTLKSDRGLSFLSFKM